MFDDLNSRSINPPLIKCTDVPQFTALQMAASRFRKDPKLHLKHLLADAFRCQGLIAVHKTSPSFEEGFAHNNNNNENGNNGGGDGAKKEAASPYLLRRENSATFGNDAASGPPPGRFSGHHPRRIILDYSRQHVNGETMELLFDLADMMGLTDRMNEMRSGMNINFTERRAVMHHVLRMPRTYDYKVFHPQGDVLLEQVHSTLDRIASFSEELRAGNIRGCTGLELKHIVVIGIGGTHAGPEAVYDALRGDADASRAAEARRGATLRFVANVDPVDFDLHCRDLDPRETLVIVTSKSFTTAETMQNARTARRWMVKTILGDAATTATTTTTTTSVPGRHRRSTTTS